MTFKATMDSKVKAISFAIIILFLLLTMEPIIFGDGKNLEVSILIGLCIFPVIGISYALSPRSYHISENSIGIERLTNTININISEVKTLSQISKEKLNWSIRTFGVGGLFGYFGKFWNQEFGHMTWYCTRRDKLVMIVTKNDKKILISPDDSELFVSEIGERLKAE